MSARYKMLKYTSAYSWPLRDCVTARSFWTMMQYCVETWSVIPYSHLGIPPLQDSQVYAEVETPVWFQHTYWRPLPQWKCFCAHNYIRIIAGAITTPHAVMGNQACGCAAVTVLFAQAALLSVKFVIVVHSPAPKLIELTRRIYKY